MNTQNHSTQTQEQGALLKPDFSHRITNSSTPKACLIDSIGLAHEKASAILCVLTEQFEVTGVMDKADDKTIACLLYAVMAELDDIKALANAYGDLDSKPKA